MPSVKNNKNEYGHINKWKPAPGIASNHSIASVSSNTRKTFAESRIINVSQKRQITLPLKFYQELGLGDQVECAIENGVIIIRPLSIDSGEFSVEILRDLVAQGLSGDELTEKFALQIKQVKKAIGLMLNEADEIASGKTESASMTDIFGDSDNV